MARGRFISESVWGSKRFANLDERGANIYFLIVSSADGWGCREYDADSVLDTARKFGRARAWTIDQVNESLELIEGAKLVRTWSDDGHRLAFVDKFFDHNTIREDRKGNPQTPVPPWGDDPRAPSREPRRNRGGTAAEPRRTAAEPRGTAHQEQEQEQEQAEAEAEAEVTRGGGNGPEPRKEVTRNRPPLEERAQRLLDAHAAAYEHVNRKNPDFPPLVRPPATIHQAHELAGALGDVLEMFDPEQLVQEVARLIVVFEEKEFRRTFKGMLGQLGQAFPGTKDPNPVIWNEQPAPDKPKAKGKADAKQ